MLNESNATKSTLYVFERRCTRCNRDVGLLQFEGREVLFDGPLDADGENFVVTVHRCTAVDSVPDLYLDRVAEAVAGVPYPEVDTNGP